MSYKKASNEVYLASNGMEYFGWVGRHVLDPDGFYTSKSDDDSDVDKEHPLKYKKNKEYKEVYCWGCDTYKDIRDFPFVSYRSTKRKKLCRECIDYAWGGENLSKAKESNRRYSNKKLMEDPIFNFISRTRKRISAAIREKSANTIELLGCSPSYAYNYLVSKFTDDMTEEAFINGEIHIDHIKPIASFDLRNESDLRECFHYTNLQPLWARENFKKGAKIIKIS